MALASNAWAIYLALTREITCLGDQKEESKTRVLSKATSRKYESGNARKETKASLGAVPGVFLRAVAWMAFWRTGLGSEPMIRLLWQEPEARVDASGGTTCEGGGDAMA
jgi:hypothetical protein